jgi:hypothetical protein
MAPPYQPYNPDPMVQQQPDLGGPYQNFVGSPGFAMASQALNNMAAMRRGQVLSAAPFSAAFDVRRQNAVLMDQKYQMVEEKRRWEADQKLRDLQMQESQFNLKNLQSQKPNPYAQMPTGYQEWALSGAKDRGVTFEDFQKAQSPTYGAATTDTSVNRNFAQWDSLNPQMPSETPEQHQNRRRAAYNAIVRAGSIIPLGGGGQGTYNPLSGELETVVDPTSATERDATSAGASQTAKDWATYDAQFAQSLPAAQESLTSLYNFTDQMLKDFEAGGLDSYSGLIQGRYGPLIDETAAYIDTMSTILTIPALSEAKLQPVSEAELATMKRTFVDFGRDPAANIGALKAQLAKLRPKLAEMDRQWQHYQKYGSMNGYAQTRQVKFPDYSGGGGGEVDIDDLPED